ncbi:352_t:CDS:2, partial [Funneliformis geosporum]
GKTEAWITGRVPRREERVGTTRDLLVRAEEDIAKCFSDSARVKGVEIVKWSDALRALTTQPNYCRTPNRLIKWSEFENVIRDHKLSTISEHDPPTFHTDLESVSEADVQATFNQNVLAPLSRIIGLKLNKPAKFARFEILSGKIEGQPDFVFHELEDATLLFPIEVKIEWVLNCDDIIKQYNNDIKRKKGGKNSRTNTEQKIDSSVDCLHQIYGYMSLNYRKFGVLTTYNRTWFFKKNVKERGTLYVSPCIKAEYRDPSLFHCFSYIMSEAVQDPNCPDTDSSASLNQSGPAAGTRGNRRCQTDNYGGSFTGPSNSISSPGGSKFSCRGGKHKSQSARDIEVQDLNYFDFHKKDVLGFGHSGIVRKVEWCGEEIALKISDISQHPEFKKELLNEVATYNTLKELQGKYIPILKAAGYLWDHMLFGIATEIVSNAIEVELLEYAERLEITRALSAIHHYGILHNDIREENILIQHGSDRFRVSFIDFAFSEKTSDKKRLSQEMATLKDLLNLPASINLPYKATKIQRERGAIRTKRKGVREHEGILCKSLRGNQKINDLQRLWHQLMPYIQTMSPRTDLCNTCQHFRNGLQYNARKEEEARDLLKKFKEHLVKAKLERNYYNKNTKLAEQ